MLRLVSAVLALFVVGSTVAAADGIAYRDPEGRFTLKVPSGWAAEKPIEEKIALLMVSPRATEIGGVCLVIVNPTPETRSATQAEIDQAFGQVFTKEFWELAFQSSGMKDVTIDSAGSKDQNGRKIYYVVANVTVTGTKGAMKAKGKQVLYAIPGSLQFVNCSAKAENYAEIEAEFESVFDSYVPKSGDYIVQAPQSPPSVLTLYAGRQFDGVTRVVAQDTPNLPMLGWSGATASVAVAGFGQWEVCDGLNYAGNCRLVAAASAAGPAARVLRIGSVRRYGASRDLRGALSLIGQGVGAAYKAAAERAARGR